jgi:patatin-like phospholipase/acyl hydrolase
LTLTERINAPCPKRILSLDGGGIRGLISLQILMRLEGLLREATSNPRLRLSEWFDFLGGTSTGAIIAACLALGMEVRQIEEFYRRCARDMFRRASLVERLWYRYEKDRLAVKLREVLGAETTLGSDRISALLLLMMRNATTESTWPVSNNPRALYNDLARSNCNLRLPLWQLVRASTAAPSYFPAERIRVGSRPFLFQDGGVTPFNNPAFQMFLMATASPYRVGWAAARDSLLVMSVGTGSTASPNADLSVFDLDFASVASTVPLSLIAGMQTHADMLCRLFGDCRFGLPLDHEVGDLIGAAAPGGKKLFSYVRYDAGLTAETLAGLGLRHIPVERIRPIDSFTSLTELTEVGQAIAESQVCAAHFAGF